MKRCPHCGDDGGVYRTYTGAQYYFWNGKPSGFDADVSDDQTTYARCVRCNRKISMKRILRETEGGEG